MEWIASFDRPLFIHVFRCRENVYSCPSKYMSTLCTFASIYNRIRWVCFAHACQELIYLILAKSGKSFIVTEFTILEPQYWIHDAGVSILASRYWDSQYTEEGVEFKNSRHTDCVTIPQPCLFSSKIQVFFESRSRPASFLGSTPRQIFSQIRH